MRREVLLVGLVSHELHDWHCKYTVKHRSRFREQLHNFGAKAL